MTELKEIKIHINKEDLEEPEIKIEEDSKIKDTLVRFPKHPVRHQYHNRKFYPKVEIPEPHTPSNKWNIGCLYLDKECIVYFVQMIILCSCIAVSLYKVATTSDNRDLWISLLSSCIGVIIPNPKLKNGPLLG